MDERAQRARWLKTDPDPDIEMPMAIDFINSNLGPDDAIRDSYYGAGFYSGFVIDCDGSVLQSHAWAWYGPGRDWWDLPLVPIGDLHDFLDSYLASPPACYGDPSYPVVPTRP
jgi:hypothetical protein